MFRRKLDTTPAALFPKRRRSRIHPGWFLLISLLLGLFLFTTIIGPWPIFGANRVASNNPNPAINTPAWLKPGQPHTPPLVFPYHYVKPDPNYRNVPQTHIWPVTMKPAALSLTAKAMHFFSNDQRLEVTVPAGTISSTALQTAGGSISLKITQLLPGAGGLNNEHIFFGTYQFQFLASNGASVANLALLHPITLVYHLSADQATLVWYGQKVYAIVRAGDPSTLLSGLPSTASLSTSQSAITQMLEATPDRTGLAYSISSNLTGTSNASQSFALSNSSITFGTQAPQALWGTPQVSQVDLNSGGLMYTYPLNLPPGPGGFTPSLALRYTSGSVDESHNLQASAPWVGEGWNLSLGSITWNQENVTPGGTNHIENVWQINDPSGISGQLIPPNLSTSTISPYNPALNSLGTGTIWHSAPESHAKIQEIKDQSGTYPCFRVFLPNGVMEEFGCNDSVGSDQSFKDSSGNWNRYRWDLDLITDRYGNQIHFHYQRIWDSTHSWIRDAQLSDIEYDDPTCHNTTTACSTWNPQVKIVFDASTVVQNLLNTPCKGWSNTGFRCDAPVDLSGSGGLPTPKVLNSYVLNDVKVEVQGNILRQYVFSYTESGPQTITDPLTGQKESISGYFNLNQIQEDGTQGTALNAPVINLSYSQLSIHYSDEWKYATPTTNCSPDSWSPRDGNGACYLWSRTYNSWYLTTIDNGEGWNESISYLEEHNNTHGVDSGAIDEPATCNAIRTSSNRCGKADDKNWSHYAVVYRTDHTNGETSTWNYKYWIQTGLPINYVGSVCDECTQGFTWGNQNDNDYADYYNGQFESYFRVQVDQPDGSYQAHIFATTTGWGLAESSITCFISSCQVAPYFTNQGSLNATALAGKELNEYDFDANNNLLAVHNSTYTPDCQPTGFPVTGGGPPNNPGDHYLISQLDQNNPVVVCDPRVTQDDSYQVDGVTDLNHYTSDARVVHSTTTDSYDTDNQGVSAYDYGNLSNVDTTGNDVGGMHIVTHSTFYPNDNLPGNVFLTNLPAITQTRDGSGTPFACSQAVYQNNSSVTTSPSLPGVSQQQDYAKAGNGGCTGSSNLITVQHTYDSSGNPITGVDGDNHLGCTSGSSQYSACAIYDSSTYNAHLTNAINARNQTTGYAYATSSSGGYGQWLTSITDPNSQTTSYQYDVLGRLVAVVKPGDSSGSPTVSYSYINSCSNGNTSPCIELDTAKRFTVGGPTSTVKQWYDGLGRLIETQSPSPVSGQTIISYMVYYNDATNGVETITSLPYAIATPSSYVSPDLTQARSVSKNDGLGRSEGSVTYSDATTIVLSTSLSYIVAQGVTGFSSESNNAYEQTTMLDAYNHQSISYSDAFGRVRFDQLFSGTASPYSVVRTIEYTYDVLGDTTQTQTFDSSATLQASYSATFDALKRRTGFSDSDLGSCSNTPLPPGCANSSDTAWHFSYDADGNLLSQIDPRNQAAYSSYDNLDRPLCRSTQSNPCSNSPYALYFYDSYNNNSNPGQTFPSGCTAPTGSLASDPIGGQVAETFSNAAGSGWRCYGYDTRGQLDQDILSVTVARPVNQTVTQTITLQYNDAGEVSTMNYPDGETVTASYDANGYLQGTSDSNGSILSGVQYTNAGLVSSFKIGGLTYQGTATTPLTINVGYDGIQRPLSVSAVVNGSTLLTQTRTYDNVGNVENLSTTLPTTSGGSKTDSQSFCYDALNRLVWAGNTGTPSGGDHCGSTPSGTTTPTYQQLFSYDSLDRLVNGPSGQETYGDSSHVHAVTGLSTVPNQYATYDATGNMTCRNVDTTSGHTCVGSSPTGAQMSYDNEGRLVSWTAPSGTTASDSFLYDAEGHRVLQLASSTSGGTTTTSAIITFDGVTETTLANGTTSTIKYYTLAGQAFAMATGSAWYALVPDLLGNMSVAVSGSGAVQSVELYAAYGGARYSDGILPTSYNYTSQRLDSQTGLLYYQARYYDVASGAFLSPDDVQGDARGMNPYLYAGGNPETYVDSGGHDIDPEVIWAVINIIIQTPGLIISLYPVIFGPPGRTTVDDTGWSRDTVNSSPAPETNMNGDQVVVKDKMKDLQKDNEEDEDNGGKGGSSNQGGRPTNQRLPDQTNQRTGRTIGNPNRGYRSFFQIPPNQLNWQKQWFTRLADDNGISTAPVSNQPWLLPKVNPGPTPSQQPSAWDRFTGWLGTQLNNIGNFFNQSPVPGLVPVVPVLPVPEAVDVDTILELLLLA